MSIYGPHYYEQEDRETELEKVRRLIHRERDKDFQADLDDQSSGYDEWAKEDERLIAIGESLLRKKILPETIRKEWARLFLIEWNRAVELWDEGRLFQPVNFIHARAIEIAKREGYLPDQTSEQIEYATVCQSWLVPNGCVDPHLTAEGK